MNKTFKPSLLLAVATSAFIASAAFAQVPPAAPSATPHEHHEWTLEEARKHAHERADMLDKMTPEEYAAHEKEHHDKWNNLTPEQKQAIKAMHQANKTPPAAPAPAAQ